MVMGDLVLLESEITPVLDKLRGAGFEITAVHNHLAEETPHVMYMHYMGHGNARNWRAHCEPHSHVEDSNGEARCRGRAAECTGLGGNSADETGAKRHVQGGVLAYGVPRAEQVSMNGMTIPPAAAWRKPSIFKRRMVRISRLPETSCLSRRR